MVYLFYCLYNECLSIFSFPLGNCPIYLATSQTTALLKADRIPFVQYTTKLCSVPVAQNLLKAVENCATRRRTQLHAALQISMGVHIT